MAEWYKSRFLDLHDNSIVGSNREAVVIQAPMTPTARLDTRGDDNEDDEISKIYLIIIVPEPPQRIPLVPSSPYRQPPPSPKPQLDPRTMLRTPSLPRRPDSASTPAPYQQQRALTPNNPLIYARLGTPVSSNALPKPGSAGGTPTRVRSPHPPLVSTNRSSPYFTPGSKSVNVPRFP